jgi:hypothetical protein
MKIKKIEKGRLKFTLAEITVNDLVDVLDSLPDIFDMEADYLIDNKLTISHLASRFIKSNIELLDLKEKEILFIYEAFKDMNNDLFSMNNSSKIKTDNKFKKSHQAHTRQTLINTVSALIERGHTDVLSYSWSFYLTIVKNIKKAK